MKRKMYWGVALLILLIGTAAVFIIQHELADHRQLAIESDDLEELVNRIEEGNDVKDNPRSDAPVPDLNPIAEVSDETNEQTSKETDLSKYDGKPLDEDFYRDNYSREELESMLKLDQKAIEEFRTVNLPALEKTRKGQLKRLQEIPEMVNGHIVNGPLKAGLTRTEALIKDYTRQMHFYERSVSLISNVLNEGVE